MLLLRNYWDRGRSDSAGDCGELDSYSAEYGDGIASGGYRDDSDGAGGDGAVLVVMVLC